ncbi:Transposon TX1 uncharacterized 149 kDa protein ORF 2 [Takifugu flavidus]|uniref:Transposon TX1 uncharacterized 149 kDa protein ORF 2 n=1 Tax=Takifugu flavidus TaxID=433684 RepID=A0A5C6NNM8_9TELE|nr:Transposon TX1 uncharacterized 149 kDa protein ORF 2 [Takifugu flavidus]
MNWRRQRKKDFTCLRQWWDHGKVQIRLLCQQHTLNVTRYITRSIEALETEIVELEQFCESRGDRGCLEALKTKKTALANLLDTKVQGALVRSRIQDIAEMDTPSTFFFGLERKRGQSRVIHSLLSEEGRELTEPEQIRRRAVDFYSSLFKWSFVQTDSLHWLLKEPLVCGGRLDVCSSATPGLKEALIRRRMVTLEQLVAAAGPELTDAQAVSSALGVRSVRLIQRSLGLWKQRLSTKEKGLLLLHERGEAETDPTDDFPELHLHPDLLDLGGPLLDGCGSGSLRSMDRRVLYANIVKTLNKDKLKNREVTVWKDRLGGQSPQWRTLYKPPIKKRTGDLQWRILHGAIATSAFLSILNPNTSSNCPFCDFNESVFHVFTGCSRLVGLFRVLTDEGQIKNGAACDAVALWKQNVRVRLNLEFCFYKATENLEAFKQQWGHDEVLVKVTEQGDERCSMAALREMILGGSEKRNKPEFASSNRSDQDYSQGYPTWTRGDSER